MSSGDRVMSSGDLVVERTPDLGVDEVVDLYGSVGAAFVRIEG